ncbi:MAG: hypothetical protein AAGJ87_16400, partial [Pseudomonadota bacterium]
SPAMAKLLFDYAQATSEPGALEGVARGDAPANRTPGEIDADIAALRSQHGDALENRNHPDHHVYYKRYIALTKEKTEAGAQATG